MSERYAVQAIPTVETNGWDEVSKQVKQSMQRTYNLVLDRHNAEVDNLNRRPNQPVGLERWHVNVLELALHSALSTSFCHSHECEEASKTSRREQELIKSHALQRRQPCRGLAHRECRRHELEPPVLERRHDETVGHESHCSLEIEWRREALRVGDQVHVVDGVASVELVDFDGEEVVLVETTLLAHGALPHGGQCLCYCVCDATQHLRVLSATVPYHIRIRRMFCRIFALDFSNSGRARADDARWQELVRTALVIIVVRTAHSQQSEHFRESLQDSPGLCA